MTSDLTPLPVFLAIEPFGLELPLPMLVQGLIIGMTYGLLAVGLVLVYRSNRVVNFAHGEIGAFGAALFGLLAVEFGIGYYIALPVGLVAGAGAAALAEVAVIRRLRNVPRLMSIVATLGVAQFLVVFSLALNSQAQAGSVYPQPPGLPEFEIGPLFVTRAYTGMLLAGPAVALGLALFLRRSKYGLQIRAAAANPETARMTGVFVGRMSSMTWAIAGAVSALTAILVAPTQGFTSGDAFGPALLLRALVGAVLARMTSIPRALAGGVALGVVEQVLSWNYPSGGLVEIALFVIILVALLLQRPQTGRDEEKGSWAAVQRWRPVPDAFMRVWAVRHLGALTAAASLAVAVALSVVISNSDAVILVGMIGFAIVGLSVGIVTGLGGQLSLGQFALGAIGATISFHVMSRSGNVALAFVYAGVGASLASVAVGLPALRIRGPLVTVTTLSFALVTPSWLLPQSWMLGQGVDPGRPTVAGTELETGRAYYLFALAVLVFAFWIARNVRRGGFGRLLVAVRDNEDNARAFAVPAQLVKVQGFLLSGFIAGIGGAVFGHALSRIDMRTFPVTMSIDVVVLTVIGGVALLAGPLLGVLLVIGIPAFVPLDAAGLAATNLGLLVLILYFPGGIAQKLEGARDWIVRKLAARAGLPHTAAAEDAGSEDDVAIVPARLEAVARRNGSIPSRHPGRTLLEARDLAKHFGGVRAVDGVSLSVHPGEILGLIGPNGAGKTTLFELLGGFNTPDAGRVFFDGQDVTRYGPQDRARIGLIRSFQDAALFPTMTVLEAIMLGLEREAPTSFFGSVVGITSSERTKRAAAVEFMHFMGLGPFRDSQIQELSTGSRRICELACLVALRPRLVLLDEPSSGIAQRETEALGGLLLDIKRYLDVTLVIIEHDIPLIMGLSTRMIAMDTGRVIASGSPEEVRADPVVVSSYLGANVTAIERSGPSAERSRDRKPPSDGRVPAGAPDSGDKAEPARAGGVTRTTKARRG